MKIVLAQRGYESLGLEYISASLKNNGHQVSLIFDPALFELPPFINKKLKNIFNKQKNLIDKIFQEKSDLVGFSVVSDDYGWAIDFASKIKNRGNVPIIFGGIHPTCVPEKVLEESVVDYVCVGEGERAIVELANALEKKRSVVDIFNIWSKDHGRIVDNELFSLTQNLDLLPFPDKDIFFREYLNLVNSVYTIATSRGCPYRCSFCYNSYLQDLYKKDNKYVRRRSVENVIEELVISKDRYKVKKIFFADDLFINDVEWLKSFTNIYKKKIDIPYTCLVHPSFVTDDAVACLVNSKCRVVGMGIQTIGENLRKNVLLRPGTNLEIKRAIELFQKTKIYFYVDIILGLPQQSEQELIETVRFLNRNRPDAVATLWLRYYPKIKIIEKALCNNLLSADDVVKLETAKEYTPLAIKGSTFNPSYGQLGNLLLLSVLLPAWLIDIILKKKLYKYFPSSTSLHLHINSRIMFIMKNIFSFKKAYSYRSLFWHLKYYLSYLFVFKF